MREVIRALSPHAWAAVAVGGLVVVIIMAVVLLSWGQSRYDAGLAAERGRWEEAGRRLQRQAESAADHADRRAAARQENHAARQAEDMEKIDEALAAGSSPLDALFGVRYPGRRSPEAAR